VPGQQGAAGGVFGGAGGAGGDRCAGLGPANGQFNGHDGEDAVLLAGHGYFASTAGSGGRGASLFPASGLSIDQQFGSVVGLSYCVSASAGGGGGGLGDTGQAGIVVMNNHPPYPSNPVGNTLAQGPQAAGGSAVQLLPFPAPSGFARSSDHFLVGGSGGGGSASNATLSLSLARSWAPGAGGGGGAGAIALRAGRLLEVRAAGRLLARGGNAANYFGAGAGAQVAPGGGGSGGSIVLQSGRDAQLTGLIDVRGGEGGKFHKTGGSGGNPPNGASVVILGGDGGPGFVRFEKPVAPQVSELTSARPWPGPDNVGALTEADDVVGMRSHFYLADPSCVSVYVRYEVHAIVDGVPIVFSDDPVVSTMAATVGAPVRAMFQAADLEPVTGAVLSSGPWRAAVRNAPGQIGIASDMGNGFRFWLAFDRTLASTVSIDRVVVAYR
jgi:hypothetical protein